MLHDVRIGLRSLLRARAFTLTTILTLGLAAAANAVILAVVYGVLVKPLPFAEAERLVAVYPGRFHSNADLLYTREHGSMFAAVAGVSPGWTMSLTGSGEPTRMTVARVSPNLFRTLGAQPQLGHPFGEDAERAGVANAIVLDHGFWIRRFGGDSTIIGRTVQIDGAPMQIVAVMPRTFQILGLKADAYTPFLIDPAAWHYRVATVLVVARLAARISVDEATVRYREAALALQQERKYPDSYGRDARVMDLQEATVGEVSEVLVILGVAVAFILLIAGGNVGTLQMTRTAARAREIAIRSALGASRRRIVQHVLAENAALALAGGITGVILASALLPLVIAVLPPDTPRLDEITVGSLVSSVVLAAAVVVGLSVGVLPAVGTTRVRAAALLRAMTGSETSSAKRLRGSFVVAEISLAVVLAVGAGLMLQTLWNLRQVSPGFDPNGVLAVHVQPSSGKYRSSSIAAYYEEILSRVRALPGVTAAGAIQHLPFSGYAWNVTYEPDGRAQPPGSAPLTAGSRIVTPGYFAAIGQPLLSGRDFEYADAVRLDAVMINEVLAVRHFGSVDRALGRTMRLRSPQGFGPALRIMGVVGNVRHSALTTPPGPEVYTSVTSNSINAMMLAVRAQTAPMNLVPSVREAIWSVDRDVPLSEIEAFEAKVGRSLGRPRLLLILLGAFAVVGGSLALIGVYGVVAYSVAQRWRELGIMIALGAERERIVRSVLREATAYGIVGLAIGIPASLAGSNLLRHLVFGVSPTDPATYLAIAGVTMATVVGASIVPAVRASRVDPVGALKV